MKVVIVRTDGTVEYVDCVNPPFLIEGLLVEKIDLNKEVTMFHDDLAEAREKKENQSLRTELTLSIQMHSLCTAF